MEDGLNRIQYVIMKIMQSKQAVDFMHSLSLDEIREIENMSKIQTIYKHIRILEKKGLVKKGAKISRANGYVLSEAGINLLRENGN